MTPVLTPATRAPIDGFRIDERHRAQETRQGRRSAAMPVMGGVIAPPILPTFVVSAAFLVMRRTCFARCAGRSLLPIKPRGEMK